MPTTKHADPGASYFAAPRLTRFKTFDQELGLYIETERSAVARVGATDVYGITVQAWAEGRPAQTLPYPEGAEVRHDSAQAWARNYLAGRLPEPPGYLFRPTLPPAFRAGVAA